MLVPASLHRRRASALAACLVQRNQDAIEQSRVAGRLGKFTLREALQPAKITARQFERDRRVRQQVDVHGLCGLPRCEEMNHTL